MKTLLALAFVAGTFFGLNYDEIMDDHVKVYVSKFKKEIKEEINERINN